MQKAKRNDIVTVALVGNPNVGKSTLFNAITGMRRHTGNWTGKTLDAAAGYARGSRKTLRFVDLPGMYSYSDGKHEHREEEAAALSYLERGEADRIAVVCDAGALERNLILVLQLMQRLDTPMVLVLNLQREARSRGVVVDAAALERALGIPVFSVEADEREQAARLIRQISSLPVAKGRDERLQGEATLLAAEIAARVTVRQSGESARERRDARLDRFLTGRVTGALVMLLLLLGIFWITMVGANACSELLSRLLGALERTLWRALSGWVAPTALDFLLGGVVRTVFWVVAVMLPPMAIFFPLFTLLEDLGYLPRVAFCLDHAFCRCKSCGKQALSMCMGLGCNAVGVTGCRIIESPRERLIAMLSCSLMPCNGRLPTLCTLISVLLVSAGGALGGMLSALYLMLALLLCVGATFLTSALLSVSVLRGQPSSFLLELPPFRRPRVGQIVLRSVLDRTLRMLGRAVVFAAPAGAVLWLLVNVRVGGESPAALLVSVLDVPGRWLGMDGVILSAFVLALPANEIVMPVMLMLYRAQGTLEPLGSWDTVATLLWENGWTRATVVCVALFMLFHWPCATTLAAIRRESHSLRFALLGFLIPTLWGCLLCLFALGVYKIILAV